MKRTLILCAALVAGCADNPREQVWFITAQPASAPDLNTGVTHNFINASEPDVLDSADWIVTEDVETSDSIFTAQFVELDGDETYGALLIVDGAVFPGIEDDDGGWTFSWEAFDNTENNEAHEAGYTFSTRFDGTASTTITWSVDKKSKIASGSIEFASEDTTIWTESDVFDTVLIGVYPQIPVWNYLVDPMGYPVQNAPGASDCATNPCLLQVSVTMSQSMTFTAVQTEYSDEDVYDAVDDAGQPFGN
jgi:hypothetical protein